MFLGIFVCNSRPEGQSHACLDRDFWENRVTNLFAADDTDVQDPSKLGKVSHHFSLTKPTWKVTERDDIAIAGHDGEEEAE